jgi:hypothetical protein
MFRNKRSQDYFEAWLKRIRKEFAESGRLSEIALILSKEGERSIGEWRTILQRLIEGHESPDLELLTRLDSLVCRSSGAKIPKDSGADLFE